MSFADPATTGHQRRTPKVIGAVVGVVLLSSIIATCNDSNEPPPQAAPPAPTTVTQTVTHTATATATVTQTQTQTQTVTVTSSEAGTTDDQAQSFADVPVTTTAPRARPTPRAAETPERRVAPKETPGRSGPFKNCTEARAAAAAPLYRGEPGYAPKLDRDDDGIACE